MSLKKLDQKFTRDQIFIQHDFLHTTRFFYFLLFLRSVKPIQHFTNNNNDNNDNNDNKNL